MHNELISPSSSAIRSIGKSDLISIYALTFELGLKDLFAFLYNYLVIYSYLYSGVRNELLENKHR